MLIVFTLAVMLIVAYCHWQEGVFSAACMTISVFLAGLITFNFWEPLAGIVEPLIDRTFLQGYEDFVCLIGLFTVVLALLRGLTHALNNAEIEFLPIVNQVGGGLAALVTGYLLSGFLVCAMETLPWHQNFLGFEPYQEQEPKFRRYLPPDRVWLALMHRAGATCLSRGEGSPTFDAEGAFEGNYFRSRRYPDAPREGTSDKATK
jgi:hypothetical protein